MEVHKTLTFCRHLGLQATEVNEKIFREPELRTENDDQLESNSNCFQLAHSQFGCWWKSNFLDVWLPNGHLPLRTISIATLLHRNSIWALPFKCSPLGASFMDANGLKYIWSGKWSLRPCRRKPLIGFNFVSTFHDKAIRPARSGERKWNRSTVAHRHHRSNIKFVNHASLNGFAASPHHPPNPPPPRVIIARACLNLFTS